MSAPVLPPGATEFPLEPEPRGLLAPRNEWAVVFALVAAALLVRVGYVLTLPPTNDWYDGRQYAHMADELVRHGMYSRLPGKPSAFWPPGYPFLLAVVQAIAGPSLIAIRLAQSALGGLTVLFVHRLARRALDLPGAHLAALVTAFYPLYVYAAGAIYPIVLQAALLSGALLAVLRALERASNTEALLAGALGGWSALSAGAALPALLLVAPWMARRGRPAPDPARARVRVASRLALAYLVGMVVVVGAWAERNQHAFGVPVMVSTNFGYNLWLGNYPGVTAETGSRYEQPGMGPEADRVWASPGNEATRDRQFTALALGYIRADVPRFVRLTLAKAGAFWAVYEAPQTATRPRLGFEVVASWLSYGLLLPFALGWLLASLRRDPFATLVLMLALAYTLVHAVILARPRHRMPLDTLVVVCAAGGLRAAWDAVAQRRSRAVPGIGGPA